MLLLETTDAFELNIKFSMLESQGLKVVKMNQQDSNYLSIGSVSVFVHRDDYMKATYLLENPADEGSDS